MDEETFLKVKEFLRCPKCLAPLKLKSNADSMVCKEDASHVFPIINGIPSFIRREEIPPEDAEWISEYDEKAEEYDHAIKRYDEWLGVELRKEYAKVLECIPIKSSQRILDISTGTGAVIFGIKKIYPDAVCRFVGTDLSMGMLRVAKRKFAQAGIEVFLFHSHVKELPFENESFDIVTHFGGINTFKDISAALKEWVRVLKPNGFLLITDEGLSPTARKTRRGVSIVKENRLFGLQPPLEYLPPQLKNVKLWWFARDSFYALTCQKLSEEELRHLETDGTEHILIRKMVETYLKRE